MTRRLVTPARRPRRRRRPRTRLTLFGTLVFAALDGGISTTLLQATSVEAGRWLTMIELLGAQLTLVLAKAVYLIAATVHHLPARDR